MEEDAAEDKRNEKLMKRLCQRADAEIELDQGAHETDAPKENVLGELNKGLIEAHTKQETNSNILNYESWVRTKDHQEKLKKVLVYEAKKDMYERLVKKQAELD